MSAASRWLAIVGIGEDGVEGLAPAARALIRDAGLVVGGARHLALAAPVITGATLPWPSPIDGAFPAILARRGTPVAVLASGDPFCFGIGTRLAALVPMDEIRCLPAPSAFALACAALGWPGQDVARISFCGRPLAAIIPLLQPRARILALSADATTPAALAALLSARGFGSSTLHVMEALGGPHARIRHMPASASLPTDILPLNLVAIEVAAQPDAAILPLANGLPDALFAHDGQLTRREIRAVTLSSLAPRAGELLWDIGSGAGSVAIEWLLAHPANAAIGIEARADRAARAADNAVALGVPRLQLVHGRAPAALAGLPPPDAVFIGGGAHVPGVMAASWAALRPGGRLVANAVTIETEAALSAARQNFGGTLLRLSVERLDAIGTMHGFRPAMTITQFMATKP